MKSGALNILFVIYATSIYCKILSYIGGELKMKKIFLSLIFIFCLASPCFASNWLYLGKTSDNSQYYIDKDSIKTLSDFGVLWSKVLHANGNYDVNYLLLNRNHKTFAIRIYSIYDKNGKLIKTRNVTNYPWIPIPKNSMIESVYKFIWWH